MGITNKIKKEGVVLEKEDVNKCNAKLFQEVEVGNINGVQDALKSGANINAIWEYGDTAALMAARYEDFEILKLLLNSGADVSIKNNLGQTLSVASQLGLIFKTGTGQKNSVNIESLRLIKEHGGEMVSGALWAATRSIPESLSVLVDWIKDSDLCEVYKAHRAMVFCESNEAAQICLRIIEAALLKRVPDFLEGNTSEKKEKSASDVRAGKSRSLGFK
jgi:ankyrin repeat protein